MTTGEKIRQRRLELHLSLQDVATELEVNRATVLGWENGRAKNIKTKYIKQLAEVLKVDVSFFLDEIYEPYLDNNVNSINSLPDIDKEILKLINEMNFTDKIDVYNFCKKKVEKNNE